MKPLFTVTVIMLGSLFVAQVHAAPAAQAKLMDATGEQIGVANFVEKTGGSVRIEVNAHGLTGGNHGMHIHAIGSCVLGSTPVFASAGPHFNPGSKQHGTNNPAGPHAGDLLNLPVKENGNVAETMNNDLITLRDGEPNSVFDADGSALVIHAGPDDYVTNPTGGSGVRIACGVIEKKGN